MHLSLLQSKRALLDDSSSIINEEVELPKLTIMESHLWKDDCSVHLNMPIWEHPTIRMVTSGDAMHLQPDVDKNPVPYEALIWASNEIELRTLTRLSGHVTIGEKIQDIFQDRPIHVLCGIRAQFGDTKRRTIGIQEESDGSDWKEESSSHFEIDGPGGEYVNEILFSSDNLKAIKVTVLLVNHYT